MSSVEQNKKIALNWLEAFQTGNVKRMRELSHDNFQHVAWGDMPWAGYRDFDTFLKHPTDLDLVRFFVGPIKMTVGKVVGEGNRVYMEAESFAPLKDGNTYNNFYIWSFDIEDDKVRLVKELHDTLHVYRVLPAEAFRGPAQQRVNVLFDEPTYVIDAGQDDSAIGMPGKAASADS